MGGRVGGWEVGRQHGERGGNQLWHHTTAFAPNVPHLPHPGGVSELMGGDRPVYVGPRSRLGSLGHSMSRMYSYPTITKIYRAWDYKIPVG